MKKYNLAGKITYILGALLFLIGFLTVTDKVSYFKLIPSLSVAIKFLIVGLVLVMATNSKMFKVQ
jgi:membrane-bound ClpP family serine protease